MKTDYLNLVSTRSNDGDHAALQRWYSDHIGILWHCQALHGARLMRRISAQGHDADYLCAYAFVDEAGFQSFEAGPDREAARQVLLQGWGREGITITERRQYQRLWQQRRRALDPLQAVHTLHSLQLTLGDEVQAQRWLVEQVHAAFERQGVAAAALWWGAMHDGQHEVMLHWQADEALESLPDWRADAWGQAPTSITPRWRWSGRVVADWTV